MLIIQARMGSKRLPGKVLLPLGDTTVIGRVIRACKEAGHPVVVAIPDTKQNDILADEIQKHGVDVFRGSEDDVLDRYYQCAKKYDAKWIGRVTADCPFIDSALIKKLVESLQSLSASGKANYISNTFFRSYPKGLDFECFTFDMLQKAHEEATRPYDREHVTPWIARNMQSVTQMIDADLSYLNLSLDTDEDYRRLCDLDKMRSQ